MSRNKRNGFALLEVTICAGIFSIIVLSSVMLISNLLLVNKRILVGQDKLENLRIGQYFFCEQIRDCDELQVKVNSDSTLKNIRLYHMDKDTNKLVVGHTFEFSDNEIKFGGVDSKGKAYNNSLAQNISDVKFWYDEQLNLIHVKIATDNSPPLDFIMFIPNKKVNMHVS